MSEANDLMKRIRIASPCPARWEDMAGDDRKRFCNQCQLHVYNFSAMNSEEVAGLLEKKSGRLCGRFYKRTDGSVLTKDCPVGAGRVRRKCIAIFALLGGFLTALTYAVTSREKDNARIEPAVDQARYVADTLLVKMGLKGRSAYVMGEACTIPAAKGASAPAPVDNPDSK